MQYRLVKKGSGWYNEPRRHALAAKGVSTTSNATNRAMTTCPIQRDVPESVAKKNPQYIAMRNRAALATFETPFDKLSPGGQAGVEIALNRMLSNDHSRGGYSGEYEKYIREGGANPREAQRKKEAKKKAFDALPIKKGDLYYTSWGYDQTNYDFIIVDKISPTGKTALCRRAQFETIGQGAQTNEQKPVKKPFGKQFRMKVAKNDDGSYTLKGSYIYCGDKDSDSKRFDYFSKARPNDTFHETDPMFGH